MKQSFKLVSFALKGFFFHDLTIFAQLDVVLKILPQAVCTRYGLTVGATMAPLVRVLLLVFFPISYPISKVGLICDYVYNCYECGRN